MVFAAGYIFACNLLIWPRLGINLYQTTTLLIIAYAASSLPTNARVLVGAVSQLQPSLKDAARTHGAGALVAWARGVLPVVSRPAGAGSEEPPVAEDAGPGGLGRAGPAVPERAVRR